MAHYTDLEKNQISRRLNISQSIDDCQSPDSEVELLTAESIDENITAHVEMKTFLPSWKIHVQSMRRALESSATTHSKKLAKFYQQQNQLIQDFEDSATLVTGTSEERERITGREEVPKFGLHVKVAIRGSLAVNIMLLIVKILVSVQSGSLSILASAFDSSLDLLSGVIVALTERAITKRDPIKYPQGKTRLEPLGLIVLASLMTMVSVNVIFEGIRRIVDGPVPNNLGATDLGLLGTVVGAKILLYLYCRRLKGSSSAQALALDHRNDVLTNLFGTLSSFLGSIWWPYLDPIGAILFSFFVIYTWLNNGLENMRVIVGHTAPPEFLKQLTFLAMHHDERILQVDTVRAFHFGVNYLVELDIVLPEDMILKDTHDIGESLQIKLELLPEVDRAFVHIDYEGTHKPEHKVV